MRKFLALWLSLLSVVTLAQPYTTKRIKFLLDGVQQKGEVQRDLSKYPYGAAGLNSLVADAESNLRPFTITIKGGPLDGQVLPALSSATAAPSWLPQVVYTYANGKLVLESAASSSGETPYLSFARVDGQALSVGSGDLTPLFANMFYHPGPLQNQGNLVWEWTLQPVNGSAGVPANVAIRVTFRKGTGSETYSHTFTPNVGTRINLWTGTGGTVTPPTSNTGSTVAWLSGVRYSLTAANLLTVEAAGETVRLRFERQDGTALNGTNPNGVAVNSTDYFYFGELIGQGSYDKQWTATFSPAVANVPLKLTFKRESTNELVSYNYTPASGANRVQVTGGTTTSPPPTTPPVVSGNEADFVAYADQGWGSADMKYLENSDIRVGFRKSVGATICHISLKSDNRGLVNDFKVSDALPGDPRYGTTLSDKGRQVQFGSDYFTPGNRWQAAPPANGKSNNTGDFGFDTGGNTVQGGSLGQYYAESTILASAVVQHPTRGTMFYAKVRPKVWAVPNVDGPVILEEWVWLNGKTINYHARHTFMDRDYSQVTFESRGQENPCVMGIGWLSNKRAVFGSPFAGSGTVDVRGPAFGFSGPFFTSECWTGMYDHSNQNVGLTLYTPDNSRFETNQDRDIFGDEDKYEVAYMKADRMINYDNAGVYDDGGYIIVGTEGEARATINALPRPLQTLDFDMTTDNHKWWNLDCTVKKVANLPDGAKWKCEIGYTKIDAGNGSTVKGGRFASPYRAWKASDITQIKFDMAVQGASTLKFFWYKPGWSNGAPEYETSIPVTGDGQRRTYTVNVAGLPNWDGTITTFGLMANGGTNAGATLIPYRIYKP